MVKCISGTWSAWYTFVSSNHSFRSFKLLYEKKLGNNTTKALELSQSVKCSVICLLPNFYWSTCRFYAVLYDTFTLQILTVSLHLQSNFLQIGLPSHYWNTSNNWLLKDNLQKLKVTTSQQMTDCDNSSVSVVDKFFVKFFYL